MRVFIATLALAATCAVHAAPCVVLQYDEMKEMNVGELSQARAKALATYQANNRATTDLFFSRPNATERAEMLVLETQADACKNEAGRIERVIARKEKD